LDYKLFNFGSGQWLSFDWIESNMISLTFLKSQIKSDSNSDGSNKFLGSNSTTLNLIRIEYKIHNSKFDFIQTQNENFRFETMRAEIWFKSNSNDQLIRDDMKVRSDPTQNQIK
jgi:hypothetical protein